VRWRFHAKSEQETFEKTHPDGTQNRQLVNQVCSCVGGAKEKDDCAKPCKWGHSVGSV